MKNFLNRWIRMLAKDVFANGSIPFAITLLSFENKNIAILFIPDNCSISIICSRKSKLIILYVSRHTTLTSLIRRRRQTNARWNVFSVSSPHDMEFDKTCMVQTCWPDLAPLTEKLYACLWTGDMINLASTLHILRVSNSLLLFQCTHVLTAVTKYSDATRNLCQISEMTSSHLI